MSVDLDTRARGAADGLRRAAGALDVPEWHGDKQRHPFRAKRFVWLAAAAVLLVAMVATVLLREDKEPVVTTPDDVPVLIPDVLPDGATSMGGAEWSLASAPDDDWGALTVYGDPESADPLAEAELGVWIWHSNETAALPPIGSESETVRGRPAWVEILASGRTVVGWAETNLVNVSVSSITLSERELREIAEGMSFSEGYDTFDIPALPSALRPIASVSDAHQFFALSVPVARATNGYTINYQSDQHEFAVATFSGGTNELLALRWQLGGIFLEPVEVHGSGAFVYSEVIGGNTQSSLLWQQAPGVIVVITGDLDKDQLVATAESLRPASDEEWATISAIVSTQADDERAGASGTTTSIFMSDAELVTHGIAADGSRWSLRLESFDLCLETHDGADYSCVALVADRSASRSANFVIGAADGARSLDVVLADGTSIPSPVGSQFYAVELPEAVEPVEVVFFDASGDEIGRVPVTSAG